MENQASYLSDQNSGYIQNQKQVNYQDSQANEESENNLKPLKMYEQDEDRDDNNSDYEQEQNEEQIKSENSFNDRMSEFDSDAQEHFASIYKDSHLNISDEEYNDRDSNNNSYINTVIQIHNPLQSSEAFNNPGISREDDDFLKDAIRKSEGLQKQLRMLDQYYQNCGNQVNKEEQTPFSSSKQTPKKIKSKQQGLDKQKKAAKDQNKKETPSSISNQRSDKPIKSLKRNDSKKHLLQANKDLPNSKESKKQIKEDNELDSSRKKQFFNSEQQSSQPLHNKQLNNRMTFTEPFQVPQQDQEKDKQSRKRSGYLNVQNDNKKMRSRNNSQGQARSRSKGQEDKQKQNSNIADTPNNKSLKSKKNEVSSLKGKKESTIKKRQTVESTNISSNKQKSQIEMSEQKQQYSMNPLLLISDFDDNLKNSYYEQQNNNMLQQFMIKNDINPSYAPNVSNNHYDDHDNHDYPTVSNISTNHQFFHNEYLQDQVPNLENESEEFEEYDDYQQNDSSQEINSSSYSKFSHVYDSDEENKYPAQQNQGENDHHQQYNSNQSDNQDYNQERTEQIDLNSTSNFQKVPYLDNQSYENYDNKKVNQNYNKFPISYQDNTRFNNYFNQPKDQNNNIQKGVNQKLFSFNSTNHNDSKTKDTENNLNSNQERLYLQTDGYQRYSNQDIYNNTTNFTPNNGGIIQNHKLLGSSSSARLRNADSNSLWDLSLDNEPQHDNQSLKDNQMNITELKQSQKPTQKKSFKKSKGTLLNTQPKGVKVSKKKKETNKKILSQHSIKDAKSCQTTQRKGQETINSKNSINNNPQSDKHIQSEANFYSSNSNEQNRIQQLEKQIEEKDLLIDILKQQNKSLKQNLIQVQKSKREQTHSSASHYLNNGLSEQLNIAKRFQETNKILIDRIKELDALKSTQSNLIEQKNDQFKGLKQKYIELKRAYKSKVKKNNDYKKEIQIIKQLKTEISPQNIDYAQIVQAIAQVSQNTEFKEQHLNGGREDLSRGTFYTQRSSALGDYPESKTQQQNQITKTQPDSQRKKNSSTYQDANYDNNNYYNQSIQNIQQSNRIQANTILNHKKTSVTSKKSCQSGDKTPKIAKIKQNK